MLTTSTRPVHRPTDRVDGVRAAVAVPTDWADTAQLVAEQYVEPDGSRSASTPT